MDVALTTEVLTLAVEVRYEVAVPLGWGTETTFRWSNPVKRIGGHVVGFFAENGLSRELQIAADDSVDLTEHSFALGGKSLYSMPTGTLSNSCCEDRSTASRGLLPPFYSGR